MQRISQGATQDNLSLEKLLTFEVPTPPLQTQKRIADILSTYDDLIENNLKRIKLLEQAAQNIYKEWFVNFRFPGNENLAINKETGLPVGWKKVKIREFAKINGRSIKKGKSPVFVNYIDISSVGSGYYEKPKKIAFKDAPSRARRIVENGDSIFSTVRPNRKTYAFILNPKENLTASTGFAVISPKHEYDASFLYFTISKNTFVDETVALATGTAYPAINQKSFESIEIIVPSEQLRISFDSIVIKLLKSKSVLSNQNEKLKEGRDILLPRLMNRTIEV
jgi:type I restriction enzyme S subunit